MDTQKANEIERQFLYYTGTEKYYKYNSTEILYTDGVRAMAETCLAYWLVDAICSYQSRKKVGTERFQIWTFEKKNYKNDKEYWILKMQTDSNSKVVVSQKIEYSDFPLDYINIYFIDKIILLPSEY